MPTVEGEGSRRISVDLPNELIERFDELKRQWGLRRRGAVLERLLEVVLGDESESDNNSAQILSELSNKSNQIQLDGIDELDNSTEYNEDSAIVLIGNSDIEKSIGQSNESSKTYKKEWKRVVNNNEIDLPGFVRKKSSYLRASLRKNHSQEAHDEPIVYPVKEEDINKCIQEALSHWVSLYGSTPKDNVIEAAMIWLARDIWPNLEGTENRPFTWRAAINSMIKICPSWKNAKPSFNRIIVLAGVLEDPFATSSLQGRLPTLIRRFVNSFKRSQNVTSFQTLESTMTVHGALKLLSLPTTAGASLSLISIRDAYKSKALDNHPDSGGSTETMRRINEAYQLLKELYRK